MESSRKNLLERDKKTREFGLKVRKKKGLTSLMASRSHLSSMAHGAVGALGPPWQRPTRVLGADACAGAVAPFLGTGATKRRGTPHVQSSKLAQTPCTGLVIGRVGLERRVACRQ